MKSTTGTVLLTLLLSSVTAQASVLTYTHYFQVSGYAEVQTEGSYASSSSDYFSYPSLKRFDSSLGTLTGVDISFSSRWSHQTKAEASDRDFEEAWWQCDWWDCWSVYNNDTRVSSRGELRLFAQLTDRSPWAEQEFGDYDLLSCSHNGWQSYENRDCEDASDTNEGIFDGSLDLSLFDLEDFVGSSDLKLQFQNFTYVNATCDNDDNGDSCSAWSNSHWSGSVSVSYSYTEARVPEPNTIVLLSVGLAALGLMTGRRAVRTCRLLVAFASKCRSACLRVIVNTPS